MMNNMYDILEKMNLLESKGAKPDFLDIDKDGDRREPMKQAARQAKGMDENQDLDEKIEPPIKTDPSERGKYKGKDIGDLKAMKAANLKKTAGYKERGEAVPDDLKAKTAELNFAIRAKQAGGGKWGKIREDEVGEGNDFTKARLDAIKAGKPTFRLGDKVYRVTGDTSDERRMDEGFADFFDKKQMYKKIGADVEGRSDDYVVTFKDGTRKRYQEIDGRRRVTSLEPVDAPEETDDEGNVVKRGRGRPKGAKRALGAKGPTGRSKLMRMEEDYDKDEYDEEGEMAKSFLRTIEDAAKELQSILGDDENLPEWVQKKITLAYEYVDTARDYLKANRPEMADGEEEIMAEKAVSKAQRAAAGIAYAAKKGEIPKSELRGASKEMAKMPAGELKKFAKTKEKGLPEKVKEEPKEEVEETTVSGSVAVSTEAPKAKKGGMQFGKGVYEAAIAESFDRKLNMLTEGMNINMSMDAEGSKSLTVSATDGDAVKLAQLLKLAGMESAAGHGSTCAECGGMHEGACDEVMEADLANSPEPEYAELGDTRDYDLAGGLNGPKLQSNPNNMGDNPLAMGRLGKHASPNLNLGAVAEDIEQKLENRLMDLYKRIQ
jgi:hypothetical protein